MVFFYTILEKKTAYHEKNSTHNYYVNQYGTWAQQKNIHNKKSKGFEITCSQLPVELKRRSELCPHEDNKYKQQIIRQSVQLPNEMSQQPMLQYQVNAKILKM